jgi:S1-C subfamily serine protease
MLLVLATLGLAAPPPAPPPQPPPAVARSIVRFDNTSQRADWRTPWNPGRPARSSGTGFVVAGGRIMTNAHVVADSKNLVFHLSGDATPHDARIVLVGHDCDLALVEPVEKGILDGIAPLPIGEMPNVGDQVVTMGYPAGGRWLSSTSGVVSRIDYLKSAHAGSYHVGIQTDAAINPGNSGGPVVRDGRVVGVAYQGIGMLENTGFFIPPPIVKHFLDDAADGRYDGFPQLDIFVSNLDSPAARRRAGMGDKETGVRVDFVHPKSPAFGVLNAGDILLALDGEILANDGTFTYRDQQLQIGAVLDRFRPGDKVRARVLRAGSRIDLQIPVTLSVYPIRAYETLPKYFVYGGLVFAPIDREYLESLGSSTPTEINYDYVYRQIEVPETPLPGRVMLLRRLDHPVNSTMAVTGTAIVERVNGREVHTLEDVIAALQANTNTHHVFEFAYGGRISVLDRAAADAANKAILDQYAVFQDRRL